MVMCPRNFVDALHNNAKSPYCQCPSNDGKNTELGEGLFAAPVPRFYLFRPMLGHAGDVGRGAEGDPFFVCPGFIRRGMDFPSTWKSQVTARLTLSMPPKLAESRFNEFFHEKLSFPPGYPFFLQ
jgi:hypothetical protein